MTDLVPVRRWIMFQDVSEDPASNCSSLEDATLCVLIPLHYDMT